MTDIYTFTDSEIVPDTEPDTSPPLADVEYPCKVCGKESGPYGGRGPKPKYCPEHKKSSNSSKRSPKITGSTANLAARATAVLTQLNGFIGIAAMSMGFFNTAKAMAEANPTFEQAAYDALVTDEELCKFILRGGVKSAKFALGVAYVGMGIAVAPVAVEEFKQKKAERDANNIGNE